MLSVLVLGALALAAEKTPARAGEVELYFTSLEGTTAGLIYRVAPGSNDPQIIHETPYEGRPGIVESHGSALYWSTYNPSGLWCSDRDAVEVELLVDHGDTRVGAIRFLDDKVYWSGGAPQMLLRSDLDGSNVEILYTGTPFPNGGFRDFDLYQGRFYWTSSNSTLIRSTALDGTDFQNYNIAGATRLSSVEVEDGHLFLIDNLTDSARILRTNLDGTNVVVIASGLSDDVYSFSILGDRLYFCWRGFDAGVVGRIDSMRIDGTDRREEMTVPGLQVFQVHAATAEDDLIVPLDIKPGSCPNSINRYSNGVLPIGLLGTETFDVTQVDISTLQLSRIHGNGGTVVPLNATPGLGISQADVATPFPSELCGCHELEGDGNVDLLMMFDTSELVEVLELGGVPGGSAVQLNVRGNLLDGTAFVATDCIYLAQSSFARQEAYLKASNTDLSDRFGSAVAICGDTAVVGATSEDSNSSLINGDESDNSATATGAAYVFTRTGTTWSQQAYLKAANSSSGSAFGISVDISGDTIVIGASEEDGSATGVNGDPLLLDTPNSGAAYVFTRTGTTWSQQAYLKASNTGTIDRFGYTVRVYGDTIVVGAQDENSGGIGVNGVQDNESALNSGAAYVFTREGTTWSQQAYLKSSNSEAHDQFGQSLDLFEDTIVVGAGTESSGATGVNGDETDNSAGGTGAAYVFQRDGTTWSQQAYLKPSSTVPANQRFGSAVSIHGDTVVATAAMSPSAATGVNGDDNDTSLYRVGAAYVFTRTGTNWSQEAYLKASDVDADDQFGLTVANFGDAIIVGAHHEESNAAGINGDDSDNSAPDSGAAYVFLRNGTTWRQEFYLKASNAETGDRFGYRVSMFGNTVLVTASSEDSNATGVDGSESDNSLSSAGAVYAFDLVSLGHGFQSFCNGDGGDQQGCTDCPCLNNAPNGTIGGCLNSAGNSTRLKGSGDPSASLAPDSASDLRFSLSSAPPSAFAVLISGKAIGPEFLGNPCFGLNSGTRSLVFDGLRCVIGATMRHGARSADIQGDVVDFTGSNRVWGGEAGPLIGIAAQGGFVSGETRYFQVIHRDDPLLSCMTGLNTSQVVEITFTP